jgi:diguanylate cyclase (GGDEF)-like protein
VIGKAPATRPSLAQDQLGPSVAGGPASRWSVRTYLSMIMLFAVLAIAGATVYGYVWSSGKAATDATSQMTLEAGRASSAISSSIADATHAAEGLAAEPGLEKVFTTVGKCQLDASGTQAFPSVRIDLVAPDGRVACSSGPIAVSATGAGRRERGSWLREALQSRTVVVDWNAFDAGTAERAVVVAIRIPGAHGPAGAVAVQMDLPGAAGALARSFDGIEPASVMLVQRSTGAVLSASNVSERRGRGLRFDHAPKTGTWAGIDGSPRLFGSAEVPGAGWRVYAGVKRGTVLAQATGALTRQALVGVLALMILAFAAWVLNRRVANPLRAITRAVARAGGDLEPIDSRVRGEGTAEIVALARAFQTMLDVRAGHDAQLIYQAAHDPLTGLPNRMVLREQLAAALRGVGDGVVVILWVGIDRLEVVNDSFGHDVGDRVLIDVAARLSAVARPGDTLVRFGGDEFVVLCENLTTDEVSEFAELLHRCFAQPFSGPDANIVLEDSIGIAEARRSTSTPGQLMREAHSAMREARSTGSSRCRFDGALQARATQHLDIEHALWQALKRDEFVVHYQPLLDLSSGQIIGAEALVRWQRPERGMVSPLDFIPLAEQTGQIVPIGRAVLATACRDAVSWRSAGHSLRISVNVAASQLRDQAFPDDVARVLAETGLPADQLCLEITESSLIVDADHGFAGILALRHLGVQLSIDDFGTGYSSLSYLHQMAVDELKIDRSFVGRLDHDSRDRHLVEAIIGMAHALNLTVVAEGVETDEQRELLAQMRCGLGQGYLFAEPLPSARFLDLLDAQPALLGVTG